MSGHQHPEREGVLFKGPKNSIYILVIRLGRRVKNETNTNNVLSHGSFFIPFPPTPVQSTDRIYYNNATVANFRAPTRVFFYLIFFFLRFGQRWGRRGEPPCARLFREHSVCFTFATEDNNCFAGHRTHSIITWNVK